MMYISDLICERDFIVAPDNTILDNLEPCECDDFKQLLDEMSNHDIRDLVNLYSNIVVQYAHVRLLFTEDGGILISPLRGVLSGFSVYELDGYAIVAPPKGYVAIFDENDGDGDPETNDVYFIGIRD